MRTVPVSASPAGPFAPAADPSAPASASAAPLHPGPEARPGRGEDLDEVAGGEGRKPRHRRGRETAAPEPGAPVRLVLVAHPEFLAPAPAAQRVPGGRRRLRVDFPRVEHHHPEVPPRRLRREVTVPHVGEDLVGVAVEGIAPPAAARRAKAHHVAPPQAEARDLAGGLGRRELPAVPDHPELVRRPGAPAHDPERRDHVLVRGDREEPVSDSTRMSRRSPNPPR